MHLNEHAARNVTLDTCHALQLHLEPRRSEVSRSVMIGRGGLTEIIVSFGRSAIVPILKCSNVIDHRPPGHGMLT